MQTATPGRIVGGTGAARRGIQMRAQHHDLVREVTAGDVGEGVVAHRSPS